MIICKICEKDTNVESLSEHSMKCKEVANLKESISEVRLKMETYIEKASLIKNSLQTGVAKQQKIYRRSLTKPCIDESPMSNPSLVDSFNSQAFLSAKKNVSAGMIPSLVEEIDERRKTSKPTLRSVDLEGREDYQKLAKEATRSVSVLKKVIKVAKKIYHWAHDETGVANEADFYTKKELEVEYEKISDAKVSDFLKDFIMDLSAYMNMKMEYLKKTVELSMLTPHTNHFERPRRKTVIRAQRSSVECKKTGISDNNFVQARAALAKENLSSSPINNKKRKNDPNLNLSLKTKLIQMNGLTEVQLNLTPVTSSESNPCYEETNASSLVIPTKEEVSDRFRIRKKTKLKVTKQTVFSFSQASIDSMEGSFQLKKCTSNKTRTDNPYFVSQSQKEIGAKSINQLSDEPKSLVLRSEQILEKKEKCKPGSTIDLLKSMHQEENANVQSFPSLLLLEEEPTQETENKVQTTIWDSPVMRGCLSVGDISKWSMPVPLHDSPKSQIDEFEFIKFLGKGAYGTVWQVRRKVTGDIYAMKIVEWADRFTKNQFPKLKAERDIYEIIQGDHVVKAVWTFHHHSYICFVTEFMVGGDFNSVLDDLGRLDEEQARFYCAELILAIESLHSLGIIHRDLKPENVLIDARGHIRLTDFGLSELGFNKLLSASSPGRGPPGPVEEECEEPEDEKECRTKQKSETLKTDFEQKTKKKKREHIFTFLDQKEGFTGKEAIMKIRQFAHLDNNHHEDKSPAIVGTPDYMAPEVIAPSLCGGKNYNQKSIDWWSLGVMLYQFLVGIPPFCDDDLHKVFDNILNHRIEWPSIGYDEDCISPEAYDLIEKLLDPNPKTRLGSNGAEEVKQHPFFQGFCWKTAKENEGPLVPNIPGEQEEVEGICRSQSEKLKKGDFPFSPPSVKKSKSGCTPVNSVNLGGLQLRRLDVLDKLNQDVYKQLQNQTEQK